MAAPIVAATAALMRRLNPDLEVAEILRTLKGTARRRGGRDAPWGPELGWGILDAGAALRQAATLDRTAPRSRARGPQRTRARSVTLRWTGSDPAPPRVRASGIDRYELLRAVDGGPVRRIATTRARRRTVRVVPGRRYTFSTAAIDKDGNRERRPSRPDLRVVVLRGG